MAGYDDKKTKKLTKSAFEYDPVSVGDGHLLLLFRWLWVVFVVVFCCLFSSFLLLFPPATHTYISFVSGVIHFIFFIVKE